MAKAEAAGVRDAEVIAMSGNAVTAICTAADDHDVGVIVVGSDGKSMLRRLLEPSVAREQ